MKTLQSSLRGRGAVRGRGRGRGDARFASRFTDPRFQLARRGRARGDSGRGRGDPHNVAQQDPRFAKHLRKMRNISTVPHDDDEEEEEEESSSVDGLQHSASDSNNDHSDGDEMVLSDGEAEMLDDDVAAWSASDVEFVEPRRRLAIVNCSWDHIRAVDLYAILFYALPLGGRLVDVAVYMSAFGKRMLEHERIYGPDLWVAAGEEDPRHTTSTESNGKKGKDRKKQNSSDDDDDNDAGKLGEEVVDQFSDNDAPDNDSDDPWVDDNAAMLQEEGEDGELFSQGKHRKYERDRMKYYYAIATFDSPDTAESVYKHMDGMDIEASGVVLDLRYVDDDEVFENPVNKADGIPANYKPLAAFKAAALSQTRFRISWDQDDVFRHHSIRDSFTGDTVDDDLAAYIAPPDSSDEIDDEDEGKNGDNNNNNNNTNNGKNKSKRDLDRCRIRSKYASLLEEIGGLPEECQRDDDENDLESKEESDDDDDSLNRFSDVEVEETGDSEREMQDSEASDFVGEMEATLDLDAETKAARLQREALHKQMIKSGDLGSRAELKYKLRRKEMHKVKREMFLREREAETAQLQSEREKRRQALRVALGTDDAGATHMSGKEKRKQHAKVVKQRVAAEREATKKMRASNSLGVGCEVREARRREAAESAIDAIDPRFQKKLLTDMRYHLDVSQKDKRSNPDVVGLAATVATARQAKRQRVEGKTGANDVMEYFLNRPGKRVKKA